MRIPIFIVTRGDREKQKTYSWLPQQYKADVIFITSAPLGLPCLEEIVFDVPLKNKRQYCLDYCRRNSIKRMVMVDDDNSLFMLKADKTIKPIVQEDLDRFFQEASSWFNKKKNLVIFSQIGSLFFHVSKPIRYGQANFYIIDVERSGEQRYDLVDHFEDVDYQFQVMQNGGILLKSNIIVADNHINRSDILCPERDSVLSNWVSKYPFVEWADPKKDPKKFVGKAVKRSITVDYKYPDKFGKSVSVQEFL